MVTTEENAVIVAPKVDLQQTLSPDSTIHASNTDREGNNSVVPEKPSEDGYNWRKYGQKNVKGNEYIRSYYKCSHPNCQVKKQVERSQDGRITDITYLGKHDHAKPHSDPQAAVPSLLSAKVQTPDCPSTAVDQDKPSDVHSPATEHVQQMEICEYAIVKAVGDNAPAPLTPSSQARDDHSENLTLKRRKKGIDGADYTTEKPNHESRIVVHTVSEVDIVNDGYRWRKYGQKMVKGNPNPRSYYRCSTTGCPVKKHVERASHDPKVVITTYEGEHDHSMPPIRTIVPQTAAASAGGTESNDMSKSKSEESDAAQSAALVCKAEKGSCVDPATKDENNQAIVVKTEDALTGSTQHESNHKAEKNDTESHVETKLEMVSQEANQDPICTGSSSENIDQTTKQNIDMKPEVTSTEAKRPDAIVETSRAEAKTNGLERPNAEAVNC
ncbi:hypothetical protein BVRB_9g225950 [Beta vulgaris subsp. vulgaris]|uniref:WRKY domain-containing protein n=1 Tax=Beta vulgaris subsp. vulgaris TaxID=3555 RepID=A0A0J8B8Q2_BETVV|nr:WRKY transcription factor 1 [Beta vulgaris subsp. vulgaris]KMS96358.1 hypothetical protein BVRB_9g225950 [Beta vulgaris subsp. vulgaris]